MTARGATRAGAPAHGDLVHSRFTKWGGGAHWEWEARYLEEDEHGHWFWAPAGTRCSRPGVSFHEADPWVSLVPRDAGWVASFYPPTKEISVYVDLTTPAVWTPLHGEVQGSERQSGRAAWEVTMVDLDLDVVLTREGFLYVDDEDEFEVHQVVLGYPAEVVDLASGWCPRVLEAVAEGVEPFAATGHERLRQVVRQQR